MIGIYKIINSVNQKIYIGQSIDIERRIKEHFSYYHNSDTLLHRAMKKYGSNNFSWEIIEECQKDELDAKEQYWIDYYNTTNIGYNITPGGQGASHAPKDEEIITEFYNSGNITKTAITMDLHPRTISKILKDNGIDIKNVKNNIKIQQQQLKKISQIDPQTNLVINEFNSITDIANYLGCSRQMMSIIVNQHKLFRGYYWIRNNEEISRIVENKKIQCFKDNVFYKSYNSYGEALNDIGIENNTANRQLLSKICKGYRKNTFAFGYTWKKLTIV